MMTVQLILSGFFRSGTTVLFEAAERANPKHAVFYEPCHEQLAWHVRKYSEDRAAHPIHKRSLWTAYTRYPGLADSLQHARSTDIFVPTVTDAEQAVAIVNEHVQVPAIMQVNRWGYLLPDLQRRTGLPYVHILRNPTDVETSMRRYHQQQGNTLTRLVKIAAWPLIHGREFSLHRRFAALVACGAIPQQVAERRPTASDQFLAVWLVENAGPVAAFDGQGSLACVFEQLAAEPRQWRNQINAQTGFDLALDETFTRSAGEVTGWHGALERLDRFSRHYGMHEEVQVVSTFIRDTMRSSHA